MLWIILAILAVLIIAVIGMYNGLVQSRIKVDNAWSQIDVQLQRRFDLIPNFVETVKGYAKHESKTLEGVMQARYSCMSANSPEERAKNENMLSGTLKSLFAVTENYPQLQANENFLSLQENLRNLEDEIANSRKYYNGCVKLLNNKIEVFPSNLVAKRFHYEKKVLFEVSNQEERVAPKVQF